MILLKNITLLGILTFSSISMITAQHTTLKEQGVVDLSDGPAERYIQKITDRNRSGYTVTVVDTHSPLYRIEQFKDGKAPKELLLKLVKEKGVSQSAKLRVLLEYTKYPEIKLEATKMLVRSLNHGPTNTYQFLRSLSNDKKDYLVSKVFNLLERIPAKRPEDVGAKEAGWVREDISRRLPSFNRIGYVNKNLKKLLKIAGDKLPHYHTAVQYDKYTRSTDKRQRKIVAKHLGNGAKVVN